MRAREHDVSDEVLAIYFPKIELYIDFNQRLLNRRTLDAQSRSHEPLHEVYS